MYFSLIQSYFIVDNHQNTEEKSWIIALSLTSAVFLCLFLTLCCIFRKHLLIKCKNSHTSNLHVDTIHLKRLPQIADSEESLFNIHVDRKNK